MEDIKKQKPKNKTTIRGQKKNCRFWNIQCRPIFNSGETQKGVVFVDN